MKYTYDLAIKKIVQKYQKYDWRDNHIVLNLLDELRELAEIQIVQQKHKKEIKNKSNIHDAPRH